MRRLLWVAAAVLIFAGVLIAQRPTFRAGVDLVAVDVRVIDKDGHPIVDLKPGDFQVEIGGHKRSVVSADFVRIGTSTLSQDTGPRAGAAPETAGVAPPPDDGRFVIVAIDAMSFDSTASRGVAAAIARFVGGFTPQDRVGLYTFPLGPKVEPTVDRAEVERELGHLIGQADDTQAITIAPSELVDISAGDPLATSRAVARNCGAAGNPAPMRGRGESGGRLGACNPETCAGRVLCEVGNRLLQDEAGAVASLGMFGDFLRGLGHAPGRKIVVLVSAGSPTSDRPGGRPDLGALPQELGGQAAQANAAIYALFLDQHLLSQNRAEHSKGLGGSTDQGRDSAVLQQWLSLFAGSAGGVLLTDLVGDGDIVFNRVLSETSAYYLLGVAPDTEDRDGRARELKVKVSRKGATVRSRTWITIGI